MLVYCQRLVLLFHNTSPLHIFPPPEFALSSTHSVATVSTSQSFKHTTNLRPLLRFSNLRWPQYLSFSPLHPISYVQVHLQKIAYSLMKMDLKRKATDARSCPRPLKKRNAVTAGIGRAVDSESNGLGFGYFGRTDDREDVSEILPPSLSLSCPVSQPQLTS